jgi:hypothetical protein
MGKALRLETIRNEMKPKFALKEQSIIAQWQRPGLRNVSNASKP